VFQRAIKGALIAIDFLTVLPVMKRAVQKDEFLWAIPFFPVAGLVIGLILYISFLITKNIFPPFLSDALVLFLWVFTTGALHIDGVQDFLDGFYAGETRERILEVMKDPHAGAIGTAGVVIVLLLKFACIHSLPPEIKAGSLLLVPAISRAMIIIPAYFLPYAREEGVGRDFVEGVEVWHLIIACILSVIFVLPFGKDALLLIFTNALILLLFTLYLKRKLNGITGDCLGFLCETLEVSSLIVLCSGAGTDGQ
jgi:adenosylcobinamide-GDP ribazoletransferase